MTNEELLDVVKMRLDGCTIDEIGKKYGMSNAGVKIEIRSIMYIINGDKRKAWNRVSAKIIYPRIRERLNERNWTILELANECGISRQCLYKLLYGETNRPQIGSKYLIAKALDMSVEEAFRKETHDDA